MSTQINISEAAVERRALELGRAQARAELEAEAIAAQQAQEDAHRAAQEEYARRVTTARAGVIAAQSKLAERAAIALEIAPLVARLIKTDNEVTRELNAALLPAFEFGRHYMGWNESDIAQQLGGTSASIHAQLGIHPGDDETQWAALILAAIVNGHLQIGTHLEGGRAGVVVAGPQSITYKFN